MEAIFMVVGAAALYLLVLPLFGLLVGIMVRILLPYGAGVLALYMLACYSCNIGQVLLFTTGASVLWVAIVLRSRSKLQKVQGRLGWYEGHYSSALNVLTLSMYPR